MEKTIKTGKYSEREYESGGEEECIESPMLFCMKANRRKRRGSLAMGGEKWRWMGGMREGRK